MSSNRSRKSTNPLQSSDAKSSIVKEENCNDAVSICRICMRTSASDVPLLPIEDDIKSNIQVALKQKILRKDPYQQICLMCCNFLEIIVDFKDAALKANQLLSKGKPLKFDANDEWHQSSGAVTRCKDAVQAHLKHIIASSEERVELKQEPLTDVEPNEKRECPDDTSVPETSLIKEEPIKYDSDSKSASDNDDNDDDADDKDFAPPLESKEEGRSDSESIDDKDDEEFKAAPKGKAKKKKEVAKDQPKRPRKKRRLKENCTFVPELCALCGKRVCAASVESHRNQHLGIKPYSCTVPGCKLEFYSLHLQKLHLHRSHIAVKTHKCHVCDKMIRGPKSALTEHLRRHDLKDRNFVCTVCGKGFTLERYLKQHGMVHSDEFPHACSFCGKRFNNKWSMRTHEKTHLKHTSAPAPIAESSGNAVQNTDNNWMMNLGV